MDEKDLEAVRVRLQKVEQRMRIVVAAWIISLGVTALFSLAVQRGLASPAPAVIRASRVEIVDARGEPRIILRADDPVKTAAIQLLDYEGIVRFEIHLFGREAAIMDLNDDKGKNMATLTADARGGSSLLVLRGRPDRTAIPLLLLQDTSGRTLFKAP